MTEFVESALIKYDAPKNMEIAYIFDTWMPRDPDAKILILEIGVQNGFSMRAWCDAYPNADVYGIDIDSNCMSKDVGRAKIFIGSATNREFLQSVAGTKLFDVIIDDGGHIADQQQIAFDELFKVLVHGGVYIIEDLHVATDASRQSVGYSNTIDFVKNLHHHCEMVNGDDAICMAAIWRAL